MVQTNTESSHLWFCAAQWLYFQSIASGCSQQCLDFATCGPLQITTFNAVREFCVNQCFIVMRSTANAGIGHPGNLLINKDQEVDIAD